MFFVAGNKGLGLRILGGREPLEAALLGAAHLSRLQQNDAHLVPERRARSGAQNALELLHSPLPTALADPLGHAHELCAAREEREPLIADPQRLANLADDGVLLGQRHVVHG